MELYSKFNLGIVKLLFFELRLNGDLDDELGEMIVSCFDGDKRFVGIRDVGEKVDCFFCRFEFGDK